jgi:hypothetical protein
MPHVACPASNANLNFTWCTYSHQQGTGDLVTIMLLFQQH